MKSKKVLISCFLVLIFLFQVTISAFINADMGYTTNHEGKFPTDYNESDGIIRNFKNQPIDYEEAKLSKTASKGDKDGEFFIDLKIEGKSYEEDVTKDIVIVLDNSSSMKDNNRVKVAKKTLTTFVNNVLRNGKGKVRFALVTYGSDVFDGRYIDNGKFKGKAPDYCVKDFTTDANKIINKVPRNVPKDRYGEKRIGGTFTQSALREAASILDKSNAKKKIIVHLTDGMPTYSHKMTSIKQGGAEFSNELKGRGTTYFLERGKGDGNKEEHADYNVKNDVTGRDVHVTNHGIPTYYEAQKFVNKFSTYTIGIELKKEEYDSNSSNTSENWFPGGKLERADIIKLMKSISSSPRHYYDSKNVNQLSDVLSQLEKDIHNTVVDGSVTDEIGNMVDLNLGANKDWDSSDYTLTASDNSLLEDVDVSYNKVSRQLSLSGLHLGKGQWINLRYKVNLRTEDKDFKPGFFYQTNGPTKLAPNSVNPDRVIDFPIPSVKADSLDINVEKIWKYKSGNDLPEEMKKDIKVKLIRKSTNPNLKSSEKEKEIAEKTLNKASDWKTTFEKLIAFDNHGYAFEYYVKEEALAKDFETKIEYSNNKNFIQSTSGNVKITNIKDIEIEFLKYKKEGNNKIPAQNIEFELYKRAQNGNFEVVTRDNKNVISKSGNDGKFKFNGLEAGEYAIKELKAPEGYITPKDFVRTFKVTNSGKIEYDTSKFKSDDDFYNIENKKFSTMYFMLNKVNLLDELIKEGKLELELKGSSEKTEVYDLTQSTKDGFKFEIPSDFKSGNYILTEKTAPMGYKKSNIEYHLKIDNEERKIILEKEVQNGVSTVKNTILYQENGDNIETKTLNITNEKATYPHTGGRGIALFIVTGVLFMIGSIGAYYMIEKKKSI